MTPLNTISLDGWIVLKGCEGLFEDLSQIEKLSRIQPPLVATFSSFLLRLCPLLHKQVAVKNFPSKNWKILKYSIKHNYHCKVVVLWSKCRQNLAFKVRTRGSPPNMHQTCVRMFFLAQNMCKVYNKVFLKQLLTFCFKVHIFFFNLPHVPIIFGQSTFRMALIESNCLLHIRKSIVMYQNENAFLCLSCTAKFLLLLCII